MKPADIIAKIESNSIPEPNSGCWLWLQRPDKNGYGHIRIGDSKLIVHRASWAAFNGPIEPGAHVLHRCDNTSCVNPDHLFVGTRSDNMRDMVRKGRHGSARTAKGATYIGSLNKWQASIKIDGVSRYLGVFASFDEARAAYLTAVSQRRAAA